MFHFVCVLYCGCFSLSCIVLVSIYVGDLVIYMYLYLYSNITNKTQRYAMILITINVRKQF